MHRILVSALVPLVCAGCAQDYPLPRGIRCESVLALRIGMPEAEVIELIGKPQSSGPVDKTAPDGTHIDAYAYYGRAYGPEDMRFWDTFEIAYEGGKVVFAAAYRIFAGVPYQVPGSGNPRVAFTLRKDPSMPDAEVRPVMGRPWRKCATAAHDRTGGCVRHANVISHSAAS